MKLRTPLALAVLLVSACGAEDEPEAQRPRAHGVESDLTVAQKAPRYRVIRDSARARGIYKGYLLAGIANTESGLAHCWSEATWACAGPNSPDCGGGAVIAGAGDGPCSIKQGGLGMFQFDAGTFTDTLNRYGQSVLTVDGQVGAAVDYVVNMVKISAYTTNAETDDKARIWINNFDVHNPTLRDQWIRTVLRYYNGCQPSWSCWAPRYQTYTDGLWAAVNDPGGLDFWADGGASTRCGTSPATFGAIDAKYRELGGCSSVLGAPISEEQGTPDGVGRYSVFEHGSIYFSPNTGAFEVHGVIRDKWRDVGWEAGILGYPTSDETGAPDGVGRFNHFQNGSIYWTGANGAFEVHGRIRDTWADSGWERGPLGYPVSDEYDVSGGRRSDFQFGSIVFSSSTGQASIEHTTEPPPSWKVLPFDYQIQETGYWCGPAATRVALSARMAPPSQGTLAGELGTTTNGTDWIGQVTSVLNQRLGAPRYKTTEMPNDPPTQSQRDRLWDDLVLSINNNYPVVTNIVAPATNHPPGYPNRTVFHYFTVVGYNPDNRQVYIADSANFSGQQLYWLSFDQLATLIPPKGYSSYQCPTGMTLGAIDEKYQALGGCKSVVGGAVTSEAPTPDGAGAYNVFENGSIYWTAATGAHAVHGAIRDKWRDFGWESGSLGYPVSDEYPVQGGKRSDFQHGSLVWHAANGDVVLVQ